jgi:GT2 family glycosyltransferase
VRIAVVIVNWDGAQYLPECLGSVAGQERRPDRTIVVDNGSVDGSLARALRQFDDRYFFYVEDVGAGFSLRLCGHRCPYVPDAVTLHVGSASSGRRSEFSICHGHRNLVWTFLKDMPATLLAVYLPQHLLLNLPCVSARGQARAILGAKWDALRGLPEVLRQRRAVQGERRIGARALRGAMARGWFTPYSAVARADYAAAAKGPG